MAETTVDTTKPKGLEGVVAGNTALSVIDGLEGKLIYRGYNIHDLVQSSFEEIVYLLLNGSLPNRSQLDEFNAKLREEYSLPKEVIAQLIGLRNDINPMEVLRTAVSSLSYYDPDADDNSAEATYRKALRLVAKTPLIVAIYHRVRTGGDIIMPNREMSLAENFLYMVNGEKPGEGHIRLMDLALVLHADHGFNASTFTCRVVAATLSDIYSGATAAIGALKGPLHGGANERVMRMLLEVGSIDNVESWLGGALERKEKIMGFGHRVYKTEDPRATHLRRMSEQLGKETGETKWFDMSQKVENMMMEQKGLYPNVDFYSASSYYMMGIPVDLFTPIFAFSRMSGWVAHFIEQQSDNRLIRPKSVYIGEMDLPYKPLAERD